MLEAPKTLGHFLLPRIKMMNLIMKTTISKRMMGATVQRNVMMMMEGMVDGRG